LQVTEISLSQADLQTGYSDPPISISIHFLKKHYFISLQCHCTNNKSGVENVHRAIRVWRILAVEISGLQTRSIWTGLQCMTPRQAPGPSAGCELATLTRRTNHQGPTYSTYPARHHTHTIDGAATADVVLRFTLKNART